MTLLIAHPSVKKLIGSPTSSFARPSKIFKTPPKVTEEETFMRRAIMFPVDDTKPKFIWVEVIRNDETGEEYLADVGKIIGGNCGGLQMSVNPVRNHQIPGGYIRTWHIEDFLSSGKALNTRIHKLVEGCKRWYGVPLEQTEFRWWGNVLCLAVVDAIPNLETYSEGSDQIRDIKTSDFRNIVDFLSVYRNNGGLDIGDGLSGTIWPKWARKMKGVRLQGTSFANLKYTAMSFPQDHPFTTNLRKDDMAKTVGLRLKTHNLPLGKLGSIPAAVATGGFTQGTELYWIAKALFPFHPSSEALLSINVLFVREDGKDLLPEHMETLVKLVTDIFHSDQASTPFDQPRFDTSRLNERGLKLTWEECKKEQGWPSSLPSPFEV